MIEIEHFTVTQARKSTLVVAGVLALFAGWQFYRGRSMAASVARCIGRLAAGVRGHPGRGRTGFTNGG